MKRKGICALSLSILLLAGCSTQVPDGQSALTSGERPAEAGGGVQVLVQKDISTWALPSDAYNPPPFALEDYAVDLQAEPCLEAAGITFRMVRFDPNGPAPKTMNGSQRRLFNQEIAAEFGYHEQLDPRVRMEDRTRNNASDELNDPQTWETWNNCRQQALRDLGGDPNQDVFSFGFPVHSADRDPAVKVAAVRWRECMEPLGIPDLPPDATPLTGIPTGSQYSEWGLNQDVAPWEISAPSAEEIKVAVYDAQCRDSSGWSQARYDAEWDAEVSYLTKHYRQLEASRQKYEAQKEAYLKIVQERGQ